METTGIDHVNLRFPADRLDEVIDFYIDTLGFSTGFDDPHEAVADDPGLFSISMGNSYRLFVNPSDDFDPEATNYRHMAIRVPIEPDELRSFLDEEGITINNTAERERDAFGAYTSYYVSDPFGYTIELMAIGESA